MTAPLSYSEFVRAGQEATERFVEVERRGDRATVTLSEPERLNVLSAALTVQLKAALSELTADPAIRAVVLTGADPGFSAGGDLRMMEHATSRLRTQADDEGATTVWRWIRREFGGIARLIAGGETAFIAAINGPAAGVGLAWGLTCDLVLASERARIVPAFGRLGLLPEVGTSWALTRALGYQGAFAFYASGRQIEAQEARELGLVHEVVAHDELLAAAERWCDRICALPDHALAMTKPLLRAVCDMPWEQSVTLEEFAEPNCFSTAAFAGAVRELGARG